MTRRGTSVRVRTAKRRRSGSTRWLARHLNDPYVQSARKDGYRSRAAYKLQEIDQRFGLLKPGRRVLDLGCAPGGWTQVAAAAGCRVIGVDLEPVEPIEGAELLQGDVYDPAIVTRLEQLALGGFDVLLSDLAAATIGQRTVDRLRAQAIAEQVIALLPTLLATNGSVVIKLVRGVEAGIANLARRQFGRAKLFRPDATHQDSSEIYLAAVGYRGPPEPPSDPGP